MCTQDRRPTTFEHRSVDCEEILQVGQRCSLGDHLRPCLFQDFAIGGGMVDQLLRIDSFGGETFKIGGPTFAP